VQAANAGKGKGQASIPFYVQQTLDYYTNPTKSLSFASSTYGESFPLKELAIASSIVASSPDAASEPTTPSSTPSESPETARDRSSSKNFGHIASSSLSGIGTDKKSKSPQPLLLARSSAIAGASGGGSSPRTQRSASNATLFPPPAGVVSTAGAPAFPYSPRGSLNMLGSWLNTDGTARLEERKRREIRAVGAPQHIFQTLDAQNLIGEPTESTLSDVGSIKSHMAPQQLLVRCKALNWNFASNCEALQCTISLHDVVQRIKLTEDFHVDFVDEMEQNILTTMLPELLGAPSPESKARRALFPLSYRSGSIYMLVRIRAVLKADTEESFEPYVSQGKLKDHQRWIDSSAKSAKHLGRFRQPLAWGAIQIFNDASRLLLHDDTQIKLYRMRPALDDATFYETITSPEKMKLAKNLEGSLSLSGFLYTQEKYHLQNLVDTNLTKHSKADQLPPALAASPGAARTVISDLVKEVHEFEQSFHQVYPNAAYLNNLYVYPMQFSLNASKIKAKSIAIRVYLMPSEGLPEKDGLVSIYGLSSTPNFHPSWTTTVDLGEKSPNFFDEIKISLPVHLTDSFHLYFQAYAVNQKVVNPKKKTDTEVETLIGVAFVPLFKDNKFIANGTRSVYFQAVGEGNPPTIPSKGYLGPTGTLQEQANEDRLTLNFATRLVSSVYTTDPNLASFYSGVIKSGDDYLLKALDSLANVPEREILARFVPILNYLFSQLCTPKLAESLKVSEKFKKSAISRTMFAIMDIVAKVSALTAVNGKQSISEELLMYVTHHFDPGAELRDQSFQLIAVAWVKAIKIATSELKAMGKFPNVAAMSPTAKVAASSLQEHGWFYLNIIVRALALKIIENGEMNGDSNRKNRYNDKFSKAILNILTVCHDLRRASLAGFDFFNRMIARFLGNLYRYMDRGFVSQLVSTHLAELAKETKVTTIFRFKFLQTLSEFEHYVPLNHPIIQPVTDTSAVAMRISFWRQHFLAGHYINEFQMLLLTGEEGRITRAKSITMFRDLLWKHSVDPRYNSAEWQMRIATMYLPLAVLAFEHMELLIGTTSGLGVATATTNTSAEWKDWCYVVMWILRYCNREIVLKSWRKTMRAPQTAKFLMFLRFVHETFAKPMLLATSTGETPSAAAHALVDEVVLTIDDILDHFLEGNETLSDGSSKAFVELSSLITALMRSPSSSLVTSATVGMVRFFCSGLRKPLFRDPTTNFACSDLCTELLTLCQQQHPQVMASATAVFYLMMKQNWEEMGEFSRMRRHSTVALSNILKSSQLSSSKLDELNRSFEAMAAHTDATLSKEFTEQVQALIQRHRRVLRDCLRVEQFTLDFLDLKLESCYSIANEYQDCPELRVQWLMEMAKLHEKTENWEEAAMCRVQATWLVAQYLHLHPMTSQAQYHSIATPNSSLLRVAPNLLAHEPPLGPAPPVAATWFTEESLISMLYDACQNLAKSEQYESATDMMSMYIQFCMDVKKYQYVSQNGQMVQEWAAKAEKSIRAQSRIPPNFYRVGFYGKGFGDHAGKEYIYKAAPSIRLADFTEMLVQRHAPQFAIEVLNNKPIAEQKIDPAKNYVQIVNLEPYFETDVNKDITWLDRTRNVRRFYYETAYNPDGGRPSEDVSKMYKRRELITGKMAFPNFFKRVEVEKKENMILQPIDCALDLMIILTSKLKAALNCVPIVAKSLQIILQGAVLAQVNAGPAAIIATFLNNPDEYPPESIEKLKECIRAFVRACNFGLILNQKLIQDQPETAALQEAMMSAFQTLQSEAAKHIDI
jgi:hypothetical protein